LKGSNVPEYHTIEISTIEMLTRLIDRIREKG
jgi:hypothetical protein